MDASMWVAKTGLDAQQTRMNVISNNLANVNTSGFKRDRAVFEDLLYQNVRQPGGQTGANTQNPTGLMLGTGVRVVGTEKMHAQGNMVNTQNPLDMAIAGDGFFQVAQPDGTIAYTRDGNFKFLPQVSWLPRVAHSCNLQSPFPTQPPVSPLVATVRCRLNWRQVDLK